MQTEIVNTSANIVNILQTGKKEVEKMVLFEKNLKENIEKNKQILDKDLSKEIVNQIRRENPAYISEMYITAFVLTLLFIFLTIVTGYFLLPEQFTNFAVKAHIFR